MLSSAAELWCGMNILLAKSDTWLQAKETIPRSVEHGE
jgi:hypothetical protein